MFFPALGSSCSSHRLSLERNVLVVIVSDSLALPGCMMRLTLVVRITEAMIGAETYCALQTF